MSNQWPPSGTSGSGWSPVPWEEFAIELTRSHPHYAVKELIGHGGMGAVYLAEDSRGDATRVAIKLLNPAELENKAYVARFEREIASLRKLHHSNLIRILDDGKTPDGYRFFVMEYLRGQTLKDLLERQRLTPKQIIRIMMEICAGVQHAHEKGIVHRDLKAANVFITNEDRVVVLDFGVARDLTMEESSFSRLHGTPGTEGHIAPELWQGRPATEESDVFSLGVVLMHMMLGEIPRVGHLKPSDFKLPELDPIVDQALNSAPKNRYRSAIEFARALELAERRPEPASGAANPTESLRPIISESAACRNLRRPSDRECADLLQTLAIWMPSEPAKKLTSVPITEREHWDKIAQWNAVPELPSAEEVIRALKLRRLFKRRGTFGGLSLALIIGIGGAIGGSLSGDEKWPAFLLILPFSALFFALVCRLGAAWIFDRLVMPFRMQAGVWNWHDSAGYDWEQAEFEYDHPGGASRDGSFRLSDMLAPRCLLWHSGDPQHLFVSHDGRNFTGWHWEEDRGIVENRGRLAHISGKQVVFSAGEIRKACFGDRSFVVESEPFPGRLCWNVYDKVGVLQASVGSPCYRPFGDMRANPLRPRRSKDEILTFPSQGTIAICDAANIPPGTRLTDRSQLQKLAKMTINLAGALRLSEIDSIGSFAWHPSGEFLAIEVDGWLHLIYWESAELIASRPHPPGEKYEISGWRADGALLALDKSGSNVWDARTNTVRASRALERWNISADEGSLANKLTSCDGLREFRNHSVNNFNFPVGVTDIAWSPDDPELFATLGGADCSRDIRIWRRLNGERREN